MVRDHPGAYPAPDATRDLLPSCEDGELNRFVIALSRSRSPSASLSLSTSPVNGGGKTSCVDPFPPPRAGDVARTECATEGAARIDMVEHGERRCATNPGLIHSNPAQRILYVNSPADWRGDRAGHR